MIRGAEDGGKVKVLDYSEDQLETILEDYFTNNNFISP